MSITDNEIWTSCKALSKYTYISLENHFFISLFKIEINMKSNDISRKFKMKWTYSPYTETVYDTNQAVTVLPYDQNWKHSTLYFISQNMNTNK
jgi:hypothetical protein